MHILTNSNGQGLIMIKIINEGHVEYESRSAWTTIALIAGLIVPLLVAICCVVSRVYQRSGRLSLRYQSARAAKRRNSVMALSTVDLTSAAAGAAGDGLNGGRDDGSSSSVSSLASSNAAVGSVPSSTNPRRSYDAVYRTHEPLPGKPDVQFEPKVWDLDAEYEGQLYNVDKRTAIYVPGSPPPSPTDGRLPQQAPPAGSGGPSVAVQKQILPSKFKDLF